MVKINSRAAIQTIVLHQRMGLLTKKYAIRALKRLEKAFKAGQRVFIDTLLFTPFERKFGLARRDAWQVENGFTGALVHEPENKASWCFLYA